MLTPMHAYLSTIPPYATVVLHSSYSQLHCTIAYAHARTHGRPGTSVAAAGWGPEAEPAALVHAHTSAPWGAACASAVYIQHSIWHAQGHL